ncbi:MAG: biosynthetic-type acetolactate synthase large subunit [Planctomycetia bacterium]|nr:biosynthetic-type acetolactate synthase large subunit [Planctomycetia bacterium]
MSQNELSHAEQNQPATKMTNGAEIVVETLIRNGVEHVFGYPGGATIPLHQAFSRFRDKIRVILPRHEQACGFAAQGYARSTGKVGVCMTTSGPGATNIITAIADAKLDSIPIVILTGQVGLNAIGDDSFQETPITEVCRCITKHHYLVEDVSDISRIISEALYIARTGRPGPVLVDLPKNVLVSQCYPNYAQEFNLPGYQQEQATISETNLAKLLDKIQRAHRPLIMSGGGVSLANVSSILKEIVDATNIPVVTTMPGLASFPRDDKHCLGMAGMHGTYCANRALKECDLLLVLGARFSDRVAASPSKFAAGAFVVHFDVDPSEFDKVKVVDLHICGDLRDTLAILNERIKRDYRPVDLTPWTETLSGYAKDRPVRYKKNAIEEAEDLPIVQESIARLSEKTQGKDVVITTGVGQHQLWTTLFYHFNRPQSWLSSCGLGTMGFGLPAAIGAKVARPEATVIAIEGDGSLQMNIQELATCVTEHIPVKLVLVNNQYLGNVAQWEDMFFKKNRANTYLGDTNDPEYTQFGDSYHVRRYPDYVAIAKGYGWNAVGVDKSSDFDAAVDQMLACDDPFLLDLRTPYGQHVLPMIPPGETVDAIVTN